MVGGPGACGGEVEYRLKKIAVKRGDAIDQIHFTYDDQSEWSCGHDGGKVDQMTIIMSDDEYLKRVSHERFENYRCAAAGVEFVTSKGRRFKYQPFQLASRRQTEVTTMEAQEGNEIIALDIKKGVLQGIVEQPRPVGEKACVPLTQWYTVATCGMKEDVAGDDPPVVYVHFHGWREAKAEWRKAQGWVGEKKGRGAMLLNVMQTTAQRKCGDAQALERCLDHAISEGLCAGRSEEDVSMMEVLWTLVKLLTKPRDIAVFVAVTSLLWASSYLGLCGDVLTGSVLSIADGLDIPALLADSWFLRQTCNVMQCEGETNVSQALIITFLLVKCTSKLLYVANVYIHDGAAERKNMDLLSKAFRHVLAMDQPFFDTHPMSEIRGSMNVNALSSLITWNMPYLVHKSVTLLMRVYFMSRISLPMTFLCLVSTLVIKYGVLAAVARHERIVHAVNRKGDHMSRQIEHDAFDMISSVKAFSTENHHATEYDEFRGRKLSVLNAIVTFRCLREFGDGVLHVFTFAGVLYCGVGVLFERETMTAAQLTAFFLIYKDFKGTLGGMKHHLDMLTRTFPDIERFLKLMDTQPTVVDGTTELSDMQGVIEFKEVGFEYPSRPGQRVLRGMSHRFLPRKMTAVVGESGAGKSTITKMLMRVYDATDGTVEVDGVDVRELSLKSLHDQIALVSQTPDLFDCSIGENIAYGKVTGDATQDEIEAAAKLAHCYDFIHQLRGGFNTFTGSRGTQLSGGQRQRIAIARAAIRDPKILILDEATSALDAESERLVQDALERVMEGRTTIVIAHRLSTIRKADEIICMKDGIIVERGTHDQLIALRGHYNRLVSQQLVNK